MLGIKFKDGVMLAADNLGASQALSVSHPPIGAGAWSDTVDEDGS